MTVVKKNRIKLCNLINLAKYNTNFVWGKIIINKIN